MYPKLKFIIDLNREIEIYFGFLKDAKYRNLNREMRWAFYNFHPQLKILKNKNLSMEKKREIIQSYINDYYKKHLPKIKKSTFLIEKQWKKYEKNFFELVNMFFKDYPWPKEKYNMLTILLALQRK